MLALGQHKRYMLTRFLGRYSRRSARTTEKAKFFNKATQMRASERIVRAVAQSSTNLIEHKNVRLHQHLNNGKTQRKTQLAANRNRFISMNFTTDRDRLFSYMLSSKKNKQKHKTQTQKLLNVSISFFQWILPASASCCGTQATSAIARSEIALIEHLCTKQHKQHNNSTRRRRRRHALGRQRATLLKQQ